MLGSMTACLVAAIAGLPVMTPMQVRPPMSAVIGTMLGAGFPPDLLYRLGHWIVPMLGLVVFMLACAVCCVSFFRYVAKFDAKTAYFCGMPGGLIEMTMLGDSVGADARRIALVHTARVFTIVFIVPFIGRYAYGDQNLKPVSNFASARDISAEFFLWLVATSIVGIALGKLLRLPAPYLIGPMLVSGALHLGGVTDFTIPSELIITAQVVLGASLGCRFSGTALREVGRILLLSLGSTAILLTLTVFFGFAVSMVAGIDPVAIILAYSPGGLAEMGLVALSLDVDTAFVASHHIARVMLVGFGAGLIFKLGERLRAQQTE